MPLCLHLYCVYDHLDQQQPHGSNAERLLSVSYLSKTTKKELLLREGEVNQQTNKMPQYTGTPVFYLLVAPVPPFNAQNMVDRMVRDAEDANDKAKMDEIQKTISDLYIKLYPGQRGVYSTLGRYIGGPTHQAKRRAKQTARLTPSFGPTSKKGGSKRKTTTPSFQPPLMNV